MCGTYRTGWCSEGSCSCNKQDNNAVWHRRFRAWAEKCEELELEKDKSRQLQMKVDQLSECLDALWIKPQLERKPKLSECRRIEHARHFSGPKCPCDAGVCVLAFLPEED